LIWDIAPRIPSGQGYGYQQQQQQQYQQGSPQPLGSPMLSPPIGFNAQQPGRGGSPGQFHPQGTQAARMPAALQQNLSPQQQYSQPAMHAQQQYASPNGPQNPAFRQPSPGYLQHNANGLEQQMSKMNVESPGPSTHGAPFVGWKVLKDQHFSVNGAALFDRHHHSFQPRAALPKANARQEHIITMLRLKTSHNNNTNRLLKANKLLLTIMARANKPRM
jgi:hypothetical protein